MADPLSIAGTAAGLVSLGLQVFSGITQYLDAIKCRAEELDSARRQIRNLEAIVQIIGELPSRLEAQHQKFLTAVGACLKTCGTELRALESLVAELSKGGASNINLINHAKERKKKLAYAFNRQKLSQLEERLNQTIGTLQVSLQGLGLDIAASHSQIMRTIAVVSNNNAADIFVVKSELAVVNNGVSIIRNKIPEVQRVLEDVVPAITRSEYTSNQVLENTKGIQHDLKRTHGSIAAEMAMMRDQLAVLKGLMETQNNMHKYQAAELVQIKQAEGTLSTLLNTEDRAKMSPRRALGQMVSKPNNLRVLCDGLSIHHRTASLQAQRQAHGAYRTDGMLHQKPIPAICTCRPRRKLRRSQKQCGWVEVYQDATDFQRHLPTCAYSQGTDDSERAYGLRYNGLMWFLNRAIDITFSMKSGAGGWSLSPSFKYYATVNEDEAPAFKAISLMTDCIRHAAGTNKNLSQSQLKQLLSTGLTNIGMLFREGKASPNDVDSMNRNLAFSLVELTDGCELMSSFEDCRNLTLEFVANMLCYNIPANQYDIHGNMLVSDMLFWASDCADVFFSREAETPYLNPQQLYLGTRAIFKMVDLVESQARSYLFAEALDCGTLSLAILANNLEQVQSTLEKFPSAIKEENAVGQTPVHLATNRPSHLQLLLKATSEDILNKLDFAGYTAIQYAVFHSSKECQSVSVKLRCRRCHCAKSTAMLLKADCAMWPQHGYGRRSDDTGSKRCRTKFIKGLKNRRDRLGELAIVNFSADEADALSLDGAGVLDANAAYVIELLLEKGIEIPPALWPSIYQDVQTAKEQWGTVYHSIIYADDAEAYFQLGFRDVDESNGEGLPPLAFAAHNDETFPYLNWLVDRGAKLNRQVFPTSSTRDSCRIFGATSAHYVFQRIGKYMCYRRDSNHWVPTIGLKILHSHVLSVDSCVDTDMCHCNCSQGGCTPFLWMLKAIFYDLEERSQRKRISPHDICDQFSRYLHILGSELQATHLKVSARYLTFITLQVAHTCYEIRGTYGITDVSISDSREIQEEQATLLELLEELVDEFGDKIDDIIQNDASKAEGILDFWRGYWPDRMDEEIEMLEGNTLSDGQRHAAEEIGVVWGDSDAYSETESDEWSEYSFENCMRDLDNIVLDQP